MSSIKDSSISADQAEPLLEGLDLELWRGDRRLFTGVSLSELVGLVRVRGTIADPRMEIDPEQTAKALLDLGLGIATSGMSVLASRLFAATVVDAPCDAALFPRRCNRHAVPAAASP